MIFYPKFQFRRAYEITPEWLVQRNIKLLLVDVDNTLTTHDNPEPALGMQEWLKQMHEAGILLLLFSNNKHERVQPFAERLGVGCVANAKKPLGGGVRRAAKQYGIPHHQIAVVGDQIFTDVLCANFAGAVSILVEPIEAETFRFFKLKRSLERQILRRSPGSRC